MLELFCKSFTELCDVNIFLELKTNTDSLYLALAEKVLEDCILPQVKTEWERLRSIDCSNSFPADTSGTFSVGCAVTGTKYMTRESLYSSKKSSDVQRCYVYEARLGAAKMLPQSKLIS